MMTETLHKNIVADWEAVDRVINSEIAPVPKILMLELTNACNLSCAMCYNRKMKRKRGFMSLEMAERILDEAKQIGIERVALYSTGESLLHKQFIQIVELCKERKLYTYLTSNGLLLTMDKCYQICNSGLDSFKFSIDGSSKDEYEKIRVPGSYEDLLNSVKNLRSIRDELQSAMRISAGSVLMNINEENIEKFKTTYGPYVDSILFSFLTNQGGQAGEEYEHSKRNEQEEARRNAKPCRQLWDRMIVSYDGNISACCVDFEMQLVYSGFKNCGLEAAWNNKEIVNLRKAHLRGELSSVPLCSNCNSPHYQHIEILEKINSTEE